MALESHGNLFEFGPILLSGPKCFIYIPLFSVFLKSLGPFDLPRIFATATRVCYASITFLKSWPIHFILHFCY